MSNQLFRPAAASVLRRLFASASAVSDGSSPQAAHASAARGLGGCWRQLAPALQHNAQRLGLQQPTAVQEQAFRPIRSGLPTTLAAVTGTGKTLAFLLPLLDRAMALEMLRPFYAVLLSPSRELALQTYALVSLYAPPAPLWLVGITLSNWMVYSDIRVVYFSFLSSFAGNPPIRNVPPRTQLILLSFDFVLLLMIVCSRSVFFFLIMSPFFSLSGQTKSLLQNIPEQKSGRLVHLLASGMESESKTFARLRREQPSIIVGTPKCVLAALDQCHFADEVGAVVLDEVDELLAVKRAVLDRRSRHGRPAISVVDRIVFKREFHVDEDRSMAVLQRRPNVQIISVSASHGIGTNSELNRLNYADRYVRVHLLPHGVRSMPATLTHTVIGPHADIALGPQREEFRLKRAAQRQQHLEQVSKSLSSAVAATSLPPDLFPQRITDRDGINGIIEQAMPLVRVRIRWAKKLFFGFLTLFCPAVIPSLTDAAGADETASCCCPGVCAH